MGPSLVVSTNQERLLFTNSESRTLTHSRSLMNILQPRMDPTDHKV